MDIVASPESPMGASLRRALDDDRIRPAYQPMVELASGETVAEETLARIVLEGGETLAAAEFIGVAEELGLVHRIDNQLVRETILRCTRQVCRGQSPIDHFVNISADLLRHPELVRGILDLAVDSCGACGSAVGKEKPLVIEITERQLLEDIHETRRVLAPFLEFGLRLAIDDFGSGYSSLMYLADLPVAFLKMEGRLVQRAPTEKKVRAILKGVQELAGELGVVTVAENIENEEIRDCMGEIGVAWGQGYLFGYPKLAADRGSEDLRRP